MMPLKKIFDEGDAGFVVGLFRFYTSLLSRWATVFGKCFLVGSAPSPLYIYPAISINLVSSSEQK